MMKSSKRATKSDFFGNDIRPVSLLVRALNNHEGKQYDSQNSVYLLEFEKLLIEKAEYNLLKKKGGVRYTLDSTPIQTKIGESYILVPDEGQPRGLPKLFLKLPKGTGTDSWNFNE